MDIAQYYIAEGRGAEGAEGAEGAGEQREQGRQLENKDLVVKNNVKMLVTNCIFWQLSKGKLLYRESAFLSFLAEMATE